MTISTPDHVKKVYNLKGNDTYSVPFNNPTFENNYENQETKALKEETQPNSETKYEKPFRHALYR